MVEAIRRPRAGRVDPACGGEQPGPSHRGGASRRIAGHAGRRQVAIPSRYRRRPFVHTQPRTDAGVERPAQYGDGVPGRFRRELGDRPVRRRAPFGGSRACRPRRQQGRAAGCAGEPVRRSGAQLFRVARRAAAAIALPPHSTALPRWRRPDPRRCRLRRARGSASACPAGWRCRAARCPAAAARRATRNNCAPLRRTGSPAHPAARPCWRRGRHARLPPSGARRRTGRFPSSRRNRPGTPSPYCAGRSTPASARGCACTKGRPRCREGIATWRRRALPAIRRGAPPRCAGPGCSPPHAGSARPARDRRIASTMRPGIARRFHVPRPVPAGAAWAWPACGSPARQ